METLDKSQGRLAYLRQAVDYLPEADFQNSLKTLTLDEQADFLADQTNAFLQRVEKWRGGQTFSGMGIRSERSGEVVYITDWPEGESGDELIVAFDIDKGEKGKNKYTGQSEAQKTRVFAYINKAQGKWMNPGSGEKQAPPRLDINRFQIPLWVG